VVGPNESSKSAAKSLVVAGEGNEVEKVAAAAAAGAAAWFALGASEAAIEPPRSSIRLPAALFAEMAGENDEEDGDEDEKEEGDDEDGGGEAAAPLLRILAARRRCMSASALSAACAAQNKDIRRTESALWLRGDTEGGIFGCKKKEAPQQIQRSVVSPPIIFLYILILSKTQHNDNSALVFLLPCCLAAVLLLLLLHHTPYNQYTPNARHTFVGPAMSLLPCFVLVALKNCPSSLSFLSCGEMCVMLPAVLSPLATGAAAA